MSNKLTDDTFYQVDPKTASEFDSRYSRGYMTSPRVVERKRIAEVLKSLQLPSTGVALDFGCGKGDFSILLHQLLPHWRVIGLDISKVAIEKAKELHPHLEFYQFDEFQETNALQFDFIFSHHVLEYVPEISYVFSRFESLSKSSTKMLHIIPCGNRSGFEYRIASRVKNGINANGVYFFEHSAHVKRYQDEDFIASARKANFSHTRSWFVDQHWGALEWITRSNFSFLNSMTSFQSATSPLAAIRLLFIRALFYFMFLLRYPYFNYDRTRRKMNWNFFRKTVFFGIAVLYYPSLIFNRLLLFIVDIEWALRKNNRSGGKMYLLFARQAR